MTRALYCPKFQSDVQKKSPGKTQALLNESTETHKQETMERLQSHATLGYDSAAAVFGRLSPQFVEYVRESP